MRRPAGEWRKLRCRRGRDRCGCVLWRACCGRAGGCSAERACGCWPRVLLRKPSLLPAADRPTTGGPGHDTHSSQTMAISNRHNGARLGTHVCGAGALLLARAGGGVRLLGAGREGRAERQGADEEVGGRHLDGFCEVWRFGGLIVWKNCVNAGFRCHFLTLFASSAFATPRGAKRGSDPTLPDATQSAQNDLSDAVLCYCGDVAVCACEAVAASGVA